MSSARLYAFYHESHLHHAGKQCPVQKLNSRSVSAAQLSTCFSFGGPPFPHAILSQFSSVGVTFTVFPRNG